MSFKTLSQMAAISALFLGATVATAADQATFYVAPNGSDSNKGTEEAPFKTITQAQKAVRAINGTMTGDISVILRGGTYQLPATVNFTEADGGKDGHYVRYKAYPNETPLVTGGIPMSGWTIHDEKNNIWKVENVDARFRQLRERQEGNSCPYAEPQGQWRPQLLPLEQCGLHGFCVPLEWQ